LVVHCSSNYPSFTVYKLPSICLIIKILSALKVAEAQMVEKQAREVKILAERQKMLNELNQQRPPTANSNPFEGENHGSCIEVDPVSLRR